MAAIVGRPLRHLPAGLLSMRFAWGFTAGFVACFLLAARQLGFWCLVLAPFVLATLFFYSFSKRFTLFSHLILGFCLGIAPAAAWIAMRGTLDPRILWLTAAVMFWTAGFDVIYACQDFEFDRSKDCIAFRRRFGIGGALTIARLLHVAMVVQSYCAGRFVSSWGRSALAGIVAVVLLLIYEHGLVKPHDLSRVNAAFFTVNGYVSLLFFAFWAADILLQQIIFSIMIEIEDSRLGPSGKSGRRRALVLEDGVAMFRSPDILALGSMANMVRERLHGDTTYFNVNRHINPTDVCVASCRLCAFGKKAKDPQRVHHVARTGLGGRGQRLCGGSDRVSHCRGIAPRAVARLVLPDDRGIEGALCGSPPEGVHDGGGSVSCQAGQDFDSGNARETKSCGRRFDARGGAEVFSERVRRIICDHKIDGDEWLETARTAHQIGLKSNCTMLYGHLETAEDRADHLVRLRALQDETNGFVTFIPLAFHPANTA